MSVFPNPVQQSATISYQVRGTQPVTVLVTDLLGRPVQQLLSTVQTEGIHDVPVSAGSLAAGSYLVKVRAGDKTATRQLVVTQ